MVIYSGLTQTIYKELPHAGGRGQLVFRATEIARTMIIAIVTSREAGKDHRVSTSGRVDPSLLTTWN